MPKQRWQIADPQPDRAAALAAATDLSPLLAQVLLNRGLESVEAAQFFLQPETAILPLPIHEFPDLAIALELLETAIEHQHPIAICGDYDADGMTSTALLLRALRYLGAQVSYAIPSRMQEGYGINQRIVEEFHAEGVRLILTVDNGIAAPVPIARARELGMHVIVTDHHDIPPELPPADAILNPKLISSASPYYGIAGVGVAYVLAVSLAQQMRKIQELLDPLLELFALGTIADLAPLVGVNRRWVKRGLTLLPQSSLLGIQALIQVAGLGAEKALKPEAIGFRLGPRINAIGRLADPQIVIELLTTDDAGRALELAMQCEQVNQQRQQLCESIERSAIEWIESQSLDLLRDRVLVVVQPDWHHGVIGIVASRLVERYGVPVFIGTYEDESQQHIRGSARSIPEFNVFDALQTCSDLLERFGGHRAAGGFSLKAENLGEMRSRLSTFANQCLQPQHLKPLIRVDVQASFDQLNLQLFEQIDRLHPCGIENPDPVFWTPNVRVLSQEAIGQNRAHLKLTLTQSPMNSIKAMAWRWGGYCPLPERVDVAYRLRLNEWNGTRSVEVELVGVRPAGEAAVVEMLPPIPAPREITCPSQRVEFHHNDRRYLCSLCQVETTQELRIRNPEGMVLAVQPQQRWGLVGKCREDAKTVDLAQPHYVQLIQLALEALNIKDKSQFGAIED
ncbi:MAG: single-stranded-DNA-specific exonuclease RecJ [Leptolyngbyaceae cyanobacterium SL_7_1]|nr:single-stranded-DNA-specific exonuclease RecJ [Leptolyngbyaceae cyanobacterium SL_7_1]